MAQASDPASLDKLHDIVVPQMVPLYWPLTPGMWVLLGILALILSRMAYRRFRSYQKNAYRRSALAELKTMEDLTRLTGLLKRTALSAFPRQTIAPLTGEPWLAFLNESTPEPLFQGATGKALKTLPYTPHAVGETEKKELILAAGKWIEHHKAFDSKEKNKRSGRP